MSDIVKAAEKVLADARVKAAELAKLAADEIRRAEIALADALRRHAAGQSGDKPSDQ